MLVQNQDERLRDLLDRLVELGFRGVLRLDLLHQVRHVGFHLGFLLERPHAAVRPSGLKKGARSAGPLPSIGQFNYSMTPQPMRPAAPPVG